MGIKIGNNNKISKSTIAESVSGNSEPPKKSWYEKHPVIGGIIISLVAGFILLFSFWGKIVQFIEGVS